MEIKKVPISEVDVWEQNPRNIQKKDFERLKKQIQELGIYKPLIVFESGSKFIVLGGNMRIRALRELGHKEVDVSIVQAETEAQKIKYSLSDNDRMGMYMQDQLAELVYPHIEEINLEDFKVDLGYSVSIKNVLDEFGPDLIPKEKEVDENLETENECPKCGYKW